MARMNGIIICNDHEPVIKHGFMMAPSRKRAAALLHSCRHPGEEAAQGVGCFIIGGEVHAGVRLEIGFGDQEPFTVSYIGQEGQEDEPVAVDFKLQLQIH